MPRIDPAMEKGIIGKIFKKKEKKLKRTNYYYRL
jgi:hypothetical protein